MIRCLTELELKQLSSADESQQTSEALREAEAHVEHCEHCRIRLEQLAGSINWRNRWPDTFRPHLFPRR